MVARTLVREISRTKVRATIRHIKNSSLKK